MRILGTFIVVLAAWGGAGSASAVQGLATGRCEAGDHVIDIAGIYIEGYDSEIIGLVLVRQAIGFCAPPVTLPAQPLPFVPVDTGQGYLEYAATATLPAPAEAAVYRYLPYAVTAGGGLEPLLAQCDADNRSYALVACADVPLVRGTIAVDPLSIGTGTLTYLIDPCPDDCWTEFPVVMLDGPALAELAGEPASGLVGAVVDAWGTRTYCTMPGGDYHELTRLERAVDGGCGAVPDRGTNWGGLKASYR